jgi:hypothetical protein
MRTDMLYLVYIKTNKKLFCFPLGLQYLCHGKTRKYD